jgi:hypothetical protein
VPNFPPIYGGGANPTLVGYSSAIDGNGDTVVLGVPVDLTQASTGFSAVFLKPAGGWAAKPAPDAFVTDSTTSTAEGLSVSIDAAGDTIVDGAASLGATGPCYGHLFVKPSGAWVTATSATATLTEASPAAGDLFGVSVSISGDGTTVVVGAPVHPGSWAGSHGPGAAFVFVNPSAPSGWTSRHETATLTGSTGANGDGFGNTTAISDNGATIAGSAPGIGVSIAGTVLVFQVPGGGWSGPQNETEALTASSGTAIGGQSVTPSARFGFGLSISGDTSTLGVGGFATVNGTANQQVVYLFQ